MDYATKIKIRFTAYIKKVIENASINYQMKLSRKSKKEESVADFTSLSKTLLSVDDSVFFMERDITYANIENLFTSEKHYKAMKTLSGKEKQVLFLTIVEEKKNEQVAKIMNTTNENIRKIKSRAINNFLLNLKKF